MVRWNHRIWIALTALGLALATVATASAQDEISDPEDPLFEAGVEHLREGRHQEAAAAFLESYRMAPRVTTMCNLALTYDRRGPQHRVQAVRAYRTCIADDDTGRFRGFAQQRVTAIERELVLAEEPSAEPEPTSPEETAEPAPVVTSDPAPTESSTTGSRTWLWVSVATGGAAAISLVSAIALALDAQGRVAALEADVPSSMIVIGSDADRRLSNARQTADGATAAYVLSGVFGAAALGLLAFDLVSEANEGVRVDVAAGPTGARLELRGSF